jgi:hypothetical protein
MQKSRIILQLSSSTQTINILPNLQYKKVQIEQLSIPHIWYNLQNSTVKFYDSTNTLHNISITKSSPDIVTFLTSLIANMNSTETGGKTYAYTVDYTRYTITISSTGSEFGLLFEKSLALRLGLTTQSAVNTAYYGFDYGSGNILTSGRINFTTQQIFINFSINVMGSGTSYDNLSTPLSDPVINTIQSAYMFNFPVRSLPGEVETLYLGDYSITYQLSSGQQSLIIRVTDEYGNLIDVSPQSMYVTLIYSC